MSDTVVWSITIRETVAGTSLIINRHNRIGAAGLFLIAAVGVILIHRHQAGLLAIIMPDEANMALRSLCYPLSPHRLTGGGKSPFAVKSGRHFEELKS